MNKESDSKLLYDFRNRKKTKIEKLSTCYYHFSETLKDWFYWEPKYLIEKIFRKHHTSDKELLDFDHYISKIMYTKYKALFSCKRHGVSLKFFPEGKGYIVKDGHFNDDAFEAAVDKRQQVFNKILLAWKIKSTDIYKGKEMRELFNEFKEDLNDITTNIEPHDFDALLSDNYDSMPFNILNMLENGLHNKFKEGMELFIEYYDCFSL